MRRQAIPRSRGGVLACLCNGAAVAIAIRHFVLPIAWCAFVLALPGLALAGSSGNLLYQFDFAARSGDAGVSTIAGATLGNIGQSPSINSFGAIGFQAGLSTGGNGLFVAKIGDSVPRNINPTFSNNASRVFSAAVQINDANQIAARDQLSGAPPQNLIRFWDVNATDTFTTLARGGGVTDPFDAVFAFPSGNDNGDIVFSALDATLGNVLATPVTPGNTSNFNKIQLTGPLLPKISLSGKIVLRAGNTAASPIRLYDNDLAAFVTIAGSGTGGFTTLGRAPSLNGDGSVVVFAGDRGNGGGIFASIDIGGGSRKIVKIAGEGTVGVTPLAITGGTVVPPDLGYDDALQPIGFASIAVDSRVGIAHQTLGVAGLEGDSFVVSFIATPQAATQTDYYLPGVEFTPNRGIWTVRVDVFRKNGELRFRLGPPLPVVQIGDLVQSSGLNPQSFTIDALPDLYDSIANVESDDGITPRAILAGEHYLVFWASSGATQLLVRAKQVATCLTRVQRLPQGGGNAPWAAEKYAFSTVESIAGKGCAMTSFTMQTNSLFFENTVARSFDPSGMNVFMKSAHTFEVEPSPPNAKPTLVNSDKTVNALNPLAEVSARGISIVYAEVPAKSWQYDGPSRTGVLDASLLPAALAQIDAAVCGERAPIRIGVNVSCSRLTGVNDIDGKQKCVPKIGYVQAPVLGTVPVELTDPVTGLVIPKTTAPGHYILVAGKVGSNYFLADPGHKTRKLLGAAPYNNTFELRGVVVDPADRSFLTAVVNANVDLLLTDAQSRSTGVVPATGQILSDIPKSSYSQEMYDSQDTGQFADEQFSTLHILNPSSGGYSLTVLETATGPYQIQIDMARPAGGLQAPVVISGVATPGITKVYQLIVDTSAAGVPSASLQSVVVPNLFGFTQANGTAFLATAGLAVGVVTTQASGTVPAGQILGQSPPAGTKVAPGATVDIVVSTGGAGVAVPNVVGLTQAAATTAIINAGLVVGTITQQASATVPAGSVISQNPVAGTSVAAGSAVNLVVSTGPAPVNVPNVVGLTQAAATTAIINAGLVVGTITQQASATVPAGSVISQNPVAGTSVAAGSAVNLVVSIGPAPVSVPNVVGLTQAAATTAITNAGLVVGTITQQASATVPAGSVISQNPVAGTSVAAGSAVALVVSTGPAGVSVPNVVGLTQAAATTAIVNAGLVVGTITQQASATVPAGSVISQNPVAGTSVAAGSGVNLVVSTGLAPVTQFTAPTATGTGNATATLVGSGASCGFASAQFIPVAGSPASPPAGTAPPGVAFPHGLFTFVVGPSCTPGGTANVTITYPQPLPANTQYWKFGPTPGNATPHWYTLPATVSGNVVTIAITDGGLGDDDLAANGSIIDQGGPGVPGVVAAPPADIPTLSTATIVTLVLALAALAALQRPAGRQKKRG